MKFAFIRLLLIFSFLPLSIQAGQCTFGLQRVAESINSKKMKSSQANSRFQDWFKQTFPKDRIIALQRKRDELRIKRMAQVKRNIANKLRKGMLDIGETVTSDRNQTFTIIAYLGSGGEADVFKVQDESGQVFSMKIFERRSPEKAHLSIQQFNEMRNSGIPCVDFEESFIVKSNIKNVEIHILEYLDGFTFWELIENADYYGLSPEELARIKSLFAEFSDNYDRIARVLGAEIFEGNTLLTIDGKAVVIDPR